MSFNQPLNDCNLLSIIIIGCKTRMSVNRNTYFLQMRNRVYVHRRLWKLRAGGRKPEWIIFTRNYHTVWNYSWSRLSEEQKQYCLHFHTRITIVTCFSDSRWGFGLDDWIYCSLYIHNSRLQVIQRYPWFIHFTVHCYTCARVLSLH
jgi:hypothetical protein